MKSIALLLFTVSLFAADPPKPQVLPAPATTAPAPPERFQIPQEYMTLFGGLVAQVQAVQKSTNDAEAKLKATVCKDKGLDIADCDVNWQAGNFGKKVAPPVPATPPQKVN